MEIAMILGMLFLWTILIVLTVFLYRGFLNPNGSDSRNNLEEHYVRVEVDLEEDKFRLRNKH